MEKLAKLPLNHHQNCTISILLISGRMFECPPLKMLKSLDAVARLNPETLIWPGKYRHMSLVVRKPVFCICENKDADQRLCFRYIDSTIPLLPKYKISSLYPSSVTVQPGLCRTWSKTPKTGFLTTRLIFAFHCL